MLELVPGERNVSDPASETPASRLQELLARVGRGDRQAFSALYDEMAPRVHNSGHWTIEGAVTSQFESRSAKYALSRAFQASSITMIVGLRSSITRSTWP